jgi:hypothetical protein
MIALTDYNSQRNSRKIHTKNKNLRNYCLGKLSIWRKNGWKYQILPVLV